MKRIFVLLFCLTPAWGTPDNPLSTDRPSFSNSSLTVGRANVQIETGFAKQTNQDIVGTHTQTIQIPVLLRAGLSPSFEVRLQSNGYTWQRDDGNRSEGWADVAPGFKWHSSDQRLWLPATGILMSGEFATGARAFESRGFQPTLEMPLDWSLPQNLSCTVMPGAAYTHSSLHGGFVYGLLGIVMNYSWTSRFQTFAEWAGQQLTTTQNGGTQQSADFGLTFLSFQNLQLDGAIGWGLTRQTAPVFWTLGVSTRLQPAR